MIIGILVVFKPEYLTAALSAFRRILNRTSSRNQIIIINNNPGNPEMNESLSSIGVDRVAILNGSNRLYEFSGWQEGIEYARQLYPQEYRAADFIFGNDTLCHHRTYTRIHEAQLIFAARQCFKQSEASCSGEIDQFDESFEFGGVRFRSYISSYFFCINRSGMQALEFCLLPKNDFISIYLNGGQTEQDFFTTLLDPVLVKNFSKWLFRSGWYRATPLNAENSKMFYEKARSILYEFHLSSRFHSLRFKMMDSLAWIRVLRRIRLKLKSE